MRRFLKNMLLFITPMVVIFGSTTAYYLFAIHPHLTGDLGNLGAITFGTAYADSMNVRHLDTNRVVEYSTAGYSPTEHGNAPVVTIGDSFSQQREYGYPNFMANALDCEVLNIKPTRRPFQAAIALLNSGFFDVNPPRVVVIEVVGRSLPSELTQLDFTDNRPINELVAHQTIVEKQAITTATAVQYTFNWLMLKFKKNPVLEAQLDRPLFTLYPRTLYFYDADLETTSVTDEELRQMQQALVQLHALFAPRGIQLLPVMAVDKYDLYQSFIAQNPYPTKTLIDQMASVCDSSLYLDTKRLLIPVVTAGPADIYHANDTHWAQAGAQIVGDALAHRIEAWQKTEGQK